MMSSITLYVDDLVSMYSPSTNETLTLYDEMDESEAPSVDLSFEFNETWPNQATTSMLTVFALLHGETVPFGIVSDSTVDKEWSTSVIFASAWIL